MERMSFRKIKKRGKILKKDVDKMEGIWYLIKVVTSGRAQGTTPRKSFEKFENKA